MLLLFCSVCFVSLLNAFINHSIGRFYSIINRSKNYRPLNMLKSNDDWLTDANGIEHIAAILNSMTVKVSNGVTVSIYAWNWLNASSTKNNNKNNWIRLIVSHTVYAFTMAPRARFNPYADVYFTQTLQESSIFVSDRTTNRLLLAVHWINSITTQSCSPKAYIAGQRKNNRISQRNHSFKFICFLSWTPLHQMIGPSFIPFPGTYWQN